MAIKTVPTISGPTYGGVIYGLNMNIGFSNQPSTLTLDIVNERGQYTTPSLNDTATVTFGSFRFQGIVWSYNIKETASEKILQVTLIDKSIILDRHYVLLWKRGFLGENGRPMPDKKEFDFSDESMLVPIPNTRLAGFPFTKFKEERLGKITLPNIKKYELPGKRKGNLILVGREKLPNGSCDIPDTYYTFNDLKSQLPAGAGGTLPSNDNWRATHEGTLREVLNSWASDLGYDFCWNYSTNQLFFYDASRGISSSLPNSTASNIISKETSQSLEGTFAQYGVVYTAIPKESIKEISTTQENVILYSVSPINIGYFARRIGADQKLTVERSTWSKGRNQNDFLNAAYLGFVSRSLRDLYSFQEKHWEALGYTNEGAPVDNKTIINFLKKTGYETMMQDLETFDTENLPNYNFNFINHDQTLADKWNDIEQLLLPYQGKYYRIPDTSGSFFFCSATSIIEIEISVEPDGQALEDSNVDFAGKRLFSRDGPMSHDSSSAQEELGYTKITQDVQNCAPIIINLKESGLYDTLITSEIIKPDDKVNSLVIFPNSEKFVKTKIGFTTRMSRGAHPLEKNINDIIKSNIDNNKKNCPKYEEYIEKNSCISYEEVARNKVIKDIQKKSGVSQSNNLDDYVSGLLTTSATKCNIKLKSGEVEIFGPSDGSYQVVCRYQLSIKKLTTIGTEEFIFSAGSVGSADNVAEIRVINENITDPEEDKFRTARKGGITMRPKDLVSNTPQKTIKYVFAGEPQGVTLTPDNGLTNLDVSLSSDGFITTATFSTKSPKPAKSNSVVRYTHSQFNRSSYNAS